METEENRWDVSPLRVVLWVGVLVGLGALAATSPARAQEAQGRFWVGIEVADNALAGTPVMASVIGDGRVVFQREKRLERSPNKASVLLDGLLPGSYDVRIEGEGIVTEVKRGVQIFPGRDSNLEAVVKPGQGVHIVEYAEGGLAREEVAARLAALEQATTELRGALSAVEKELPSHP